MFHGPKLPVVRIRPGGLGFVNSAVKSHRLANAGTRASRSECNVPFHRLAARLLG